MSASVWIAVSVLVLWNLYVTFLIVQACRGKLNVRDPGEPQMEGVCTAEPVDARRLQVLSAQREVEHINA